MVKQCAHNKALCNICDPFADIAIDKKKQNCEIVIIIDLPFPTQSKSAADHFENMVTKT